MFSPDDPMPDNELNVLRAENESLNILVSMIRKIVNAKSEDVCIDINRLVVDQIAKTQEISDLKAGLKAWQWVPDSLCGQKFAHPEEAHAYLRAELKGLRMILEDVKAALGDRLLAKGPLSKLYAHSIMQKIEAAISNGKACK